MRNNVRVLEIASRQSSAFMFRSVRGGIMANANQNTLGSTRTVFEISTTRGIVAAKHMYCAEPCQAYPHISSSQTDPALSLPNLQLILLLLHTFIFLQLVVGYTLILIELDFLAIWTQSTASSANLHQNAFKQALLLSLPCTGFSAVIFLVEDPLTLLLIPRSEIFLDWERSLASWQMYAVPLVLGDP